MIVKTTWKKLINAIGSTNISNWFSQSEQLVEDIDANFVLKTNSNTQDAFNNAFEALKSAYFYIGSNSSLWDDLPIYISSYVYTDEKADKMRCFEIFNKLTQYLAWVKKVMTDNGVAKTIAISRAMNDSGNNSSTSKDSYSETPQLGQVNFDEDMLDYRSNFDKGDTSGSYQRATQTTVSTTHKSWDEEMKNLRMAYMSEITEYIRKIPYLIYSAYAIDTMPYPDIIHNYYEQLKNLYEQR